MADFISKFLADHGMILAVVLALNVVLSGAKSLVQIFGGSAPSWLSAVIDFISANVEHK